MTTKKTDVAALVELEREKIAGLQAERREIEAAPVPRAEAAANVCEFIALRSAQFDTSLTLSSLITSGARPERLDMIVQTMAVSIDSIMQGLLCRTIPEAIETMLMQAVDAHFVEHPSGLSKSERPARLAELDAAILKHGQREETLIRQAETAGLEIVRRADADPLVVLGLDAAA